MTGILCIRSAARQIGKTALVKTLIREFIRGGVSPWNIMYYAFDVENSPK